MTDRVSDPRTFSKKFRLTSPVRSPVTSPPSYQNVDEEVTMSQEPIFDSHEVHISSKPSSASKKRNAITREDYDESDAEETTVLRSIPPNKKKTKVKK